MAETYDVIGRSYARMRQTDPRIAVAITRALGDCASVVNVGAGTGSYEPFDRDVIAVEPSMTMIRQRPPGRAPAIQAHAEALPVRDASFDCALGVLTLHHWRDLNRGLMECGRSARKRVVYLTLDLDVYRHFWLVRDYFPDILAIDRIIFPPIETIAKTLGPVEVTPVPIPADCVDGFLGAYWRRPEAYLDPRVRAGTSGFAKIVNAESPLAELRRDLESGYWHRTHRDLIGQEVADLGYRIVVAKLT
jgi:SAM-dependent methyltransferase